MYGHEKIPPENHRIADVTLCDWWGCLPPDSLGLCPDCHQAVPKDRDSEEE